MATLVASHYTIEFTPLRSHTVAGVWYDLSLSLTYHHQQQSVTFTQPMPGISMQGREIVRLIESARTYLALPPPTPKEVGRTKNFQFSPMEGRLYITLSLSLRPGDADISFEISLYEPGLDGSVGCSSTHPITEILAFFDQLEREYEVIKVNLSN